MVIVQSTEYNILQNARIRKKRKPPQVYVISVKGKKKKKEKLSREKNTHATTILTKIYRLIMDWLVMRSVREVEKKIHNMIHGMFIHI